MAYEVHVLGPPTIERDGQPVRLGGRKPWGLLTFLALETAPPTRRDIASLLVPDADDPLAAVRWLLHQVRRALGCDGVIDDEGGRLRLTLESAARVDARSLLDEPVDPDEIDSTSDGELLEGMCFDDAPAFELWLAMARSRVSRAHAEALWWAAVQVAASDVPRAIGLVRRGLRIDPLCETKHELLVDLLVEQGDILAARAQAVAADRLFRRELGEPAPRSVRRPLERSQPVPAGRSVEGLTEVAIRRSATGDHDGAIEAARRADRLAAGSGEPRRQLSASLTLASVLIAAGGPSRADAKGLLSRSARLAVSLGARERLSDIAREVGTILWLEGQYGGAEASLSRARSIAEGTDHPVNAAIAAMFLGACFTDRCDLRAIGTLQRACEVLDGSAEERGWAGLARGHLARARLRIGADREAAIDAARSETLLRAAGWLVHLPLPLLVMGEVEIRSGEPDRAERPITEAHTIAEEAGDRTWELLAIRGLATLAEARGDLAGGSALVAGAAERALRLSEMYAWARASILTDFVERTRGRDARSVALATSIAIDGPMPDLVARLAPFRTSQTPVQTAAP